MFDVVNITHGQWTKVEQIMKKMDSLEEAIEFFNRKDLIYPKKMKDDRPRMSRESFLRALPSIYNTVKSGDKYFNQTSVRLSSESCKEIRESLGLSMNPRDGKSSPRVFGGYFEDDIFADYPRVAQSQISIPLSGVSESDVAKIIEDNGYPASVSVSHLENIIRVNCLYGGDMIEEFRSKLDPVVRHFIVMRRDLSLIPKEFFDDMVPYYVRFVHSGLKNSIPMFSNFFEVEELDSTIVCWIYDIAAQYDNESGVPFGAFLLQTCRLWVKSLPKNAYGIKNSEIMLEMDRARKRLILEGKEVNDVTMSRELNMDVASYRKSVNEINMTKDIYSTNISLNSPMTSEENAFSFLEVLKDHPIDQDEMELKKQLTDVLIDAPSDIFISLYKYFYSRDSDVKLKKRDITYLKNQKTSISSFLVSKG